MPHTLPSLIEKYFAGEQLKYIFFWGHTNKENEEVGKFIFSQWFEAPFKVDNIIYPTTEHWMMACKAKLFRDEQTFLKIITSKKPGEAKELGRQIRGFDEQTWDNKKFEIVKTGNIHKFNQNEKLLQYLLDTGDRILVEASPVDTIWGNGLAANDEMADNPYMWKGQNLLGFALMEVRDFFNKYGCFQYDETTMLPPWKKYPDVDPMDMFWRMGYGEDYATKFWKSYNALSERDQVIFKLTYPLANGWDNAFD